MDNKHEHLTYEELEKFFTTADDDFSDEAMALIDKIYDQRKSCDTCYRYFYRVSLGFGLFGNEIFEPVINPLDNFIQILQEGKRMVADIAKSIRDDIVLMAQPAPVFAGAVARGAAMDLISKTHLPTKIKIIPQEEDDLFVFELEDDAPLRVVAPYQTDGKVYELYIWDMQQNILAGEPAQFKETPRSPGKMAAVIPHLPKGEYAAAVMEAAAHE